VFCFISIFVNKNKINFVMLFYIYFIFIMLNKSFTLLFVMCVLFVILVLPRMPASVTAKSSERLRARNLLVTAQNPSSFNKFMDTI
jgi:hypothetical protein